MTRSVLARFRSLTVALAIGALVYSLGVCPAGCLEANHWYALAHHLVDHDHDLPACAHEEHAGHCDCELEPDTALLVSGRSLDLVPLGLLGLAAPFDLKVSLEPGSAAACRADFSPRATGPTATLRAHCQLFRC